MNLARGATLGSRYTLTEPIAAGGMGEVWAATDTVLGRAVAVKLLHPGLSRESSFVERFRAEARHTAGLHHPNIATVFDYGEDDGTAYLVMELIVGEPLSQIIAQRAPLSAQETASILIQAATALEAAHQGGVIHRDVKPANILITPDGTVKLTDFGISRAVDSAPLTQTGQVLGTAQYLSPEQALGRSATAASDLYALGVVGHEMLTGARPFDSGSVVSTALAHVNQPPPPLPDSVPIGIRGVISAALSKGPADRPASAAVMAHALAMPEAAFASDVAPTRAMPVVTGDTQAMPTVAGDTQVIPPPAGDTRVIPPLAGATLAGPLLAGGVASQAPGIPDRRFRPAARWLLGAAAAVVAVLTVFAVSAATGGDDKATPLTPAAVSSTVPLTPTPSASPSATATRTVATPAANSPAPHQPADKGKGNDKKRGK